MSALSTPTSTPATARRSTKPREKSAITVPGNDGIKVTKVVTIFEKPAPLYRFWRDLENIPLICQHPVTVESISETESRWSAEFPFGLGRTTWISKIINDRTDELIAWESRVEDTVTHAGTVRFAPAPGATGTEVTVTLEYDPPGGKVAGFLAKLSPDEPGHQVQEALRRFKALMEAGEIPTTRGQPVGEPQKSKKEKP